MLSSGSALRARFKRRGPLLEERDQRPGTYRCIRLSWSCSTVPQFWKEAVNSGQSENAWAGSGFLVQEERVRDRLCGGVVQHLAFDIRTPVYLLEVPYVGKPKTLCLLGQLGSLYVVEEGRSVHLRLALLLIGLRSG